MRMIPRTSKNEDIQLFHDKNSCFSEDDSF